MNACAPSLLRHCWLSGFVGLAGRQIGDRDLRRPTVVIAPHPDDETLGCGGTIARKTRAGAAVKVVFLTDGSASHRRFVAMSELSKLRKAEALAACKVLGVQEGDVSFLEFEDGSLRRFEGEAGRRLAGLLRDAEFEEVFIPYAGDGTPDHQAAHAATVSALRRLDRRATVNEYPVWFWHHWPWVPLDRQGSYRHLADQLRNSLRSSAGLITELRWYVAIGDVLAQKQLALSQHRTQTMRMPATGRWPVLSDVAQGEFLRCFFHRHELFHRYTM